jgi:ABC-type antimicrobial peptide transport system permease subunit
MDASTNGARLRSGLAGTLAITALVLALVGIYGVVAYGVSLRTREFGIRMALGASPDDVVRLSVSTGLRPAFIGAAVGLGGSMAVAEALRALLFGVEPIDWVTLGSVSVLLIGTAAAASWMPARRAAGIDPNEALRTE